MSKHYRLVMIPAILLIIFGVFSGFSNSSEEETVEGLIRERTSILQQTYFGKMTKEQAETRLQEIEIYPLYNKDIYQFDQFKNTEIDRVRGMKIKEIWENTNLYDYKAFKCKIQWEMRGVEGNYTTLGLYHLVLKKDRGIYKLSEFELKK
ncbi:MAG: hypothetical protein RR131_04180 [Anaerovorax sp.]